MKAIQIFNYRRGLAANSSSSHSILFLPKGTVLKDKINTVGDYGWDWFTLFSKELKANYIGTLLANSLENSIPHAKSLIATVDSLLGTKSNLTEAKKDGYRSNLINEGVDHQSCFIFPKMFGKNFPDPLFIKEITEFLLQDNVAIIGGNDNSEIPAAITTGNKLPIPYDDSGDNWVCRKDEALGFWTFFNQESGEKIRFHLLNDLSTCNEVPERSSTPELVDIKITDLCPYADAEGSSACSKFCYQNSQVDGKHMDESAEYYLVNLLADMKVFEVAIGGGEPTFYPNFTRLLERFKSTGIIANFTTRNISWLRDEIKRNEILQNCGCVAYSIRSAEDIKKLMTLVDFYELDHKKFTVQLVMGTVYESEFKDILETASNYDVRITLLGFKENGKGSSFKKIDYSNWLKIIKDLQNKEFHNEICIDTAMSSEYEDEMKKLGIPAWTFHTQEGRFSAYIDAVNGKFGPSSYCSPKEMISLKSKGNKREWFYDEKKLKDKIRKEFHYFK